MPGCGLGDASQSPNLTTDGRCLGTNLILYRFHHGLETYLNPSTKHILLPSSQAFYISSTSSRTFQATSTTMSPALDYFTNSQAAPAPTPVPAAEPSAEPSSKPSVYYNARLDPKNFLEGPLSDNPSTRLRQMLARPGIVVRTRFP